MDKIKLSPNDEKAFILLYQIGIAEQLRKLGMLTDAQLFSVIQKLRNKAE